MNLGTDDANTDDHRTDNPGTDASRVQQHRCDDLWDDDPRTDEPGTDNPRTADPRTEDSSTKDPWTEDPRTEDPSTEDHETLDPRTKGPRTKDPVQLHGIKFCPKLWWIFDNHFLICAGQLLLPGRYPGGIFPMEIQTGCTKPARGVNSRRAGLLEVTNGFILGRCTMRQILL